MSTAWHDEHKQRGAAATKAAIRSMFTNLGIAVLKGFAGVFGGSFALTADALESLTDVVSSGLIILGLRYASRPADDNHPYGHGKVEPVVTILVAAVLVGTAIAIALQSVENILNPDPTPESWTLLVLILVLMIKEAIRRHLKKENATLQSSAIEGEIVHHLSDMITSVAAFLGILLSLTSISWLQAADDWAAIVAAGIILWNAYNLFRPAIGELMDEHTYTELEEQIRVWSEEVEGVKGTEKCFIRKQGRYYHVDIHVEVNGDISVRAGHDIAHAIQAHVKQKMAYIGHFLVHIEPFDD